MEVVDDGILQLLKQYFRSWDYKIKVTFEVAGTKLAVDSLENATSSLAVIDKAIEQISTFRSSFGAVENRIDVSGN